LDSTNTLGDSKRHTKLRVDGAKDKATYIEKPFQFNLKNS